MVLENTIDKVVIKMACAPKKKGEQMKKGGKKK
jgi:hypothetical protein